MPDPSTGAGSAAGIVLFRPDEPKLAGLVAAIVPQVSRLYLFLNSPLGPTTRVSLAALAPDAVQIGSSQNAGSASALNGLAQRARLDGARTLVLFDQDSDVDARHVARLLEGHRSLRAAGHRAAVLGPAPRLEPGASEHKPPRYRAVDCAGSSGPLAPVAFLATSGSLLDLDAWMEVGPFRDDFFIDAVDTEWCFRARARGYSCWVDRELTMLHRVGEGTIRIPVLGFAMPRQKLFRMETYLRNSVYSWRLPHVPLGWKLRQALYLPVQAILYWLASGGRLSVLRALLRGVRDGVAGRLGPPRGLA